MPTVLRQEGFAVMIYTSDHEPKHVHVFKAEGEIIVNLEDLSIRKLRGMNPADVRKALGIVSDHREFLKNEWDKINPVP
jgi:hypothetical protein